MKQLMFVLFCCAALAAKDKSLKVTDLPPAVQSTVTSETKGADVKNILKEKDKGKVVYEIETTVQGKTRDFVVDSTGKLVSVEEQMAIESMPAPVRASFEKLVAGGKFAALEKVTAGDSVGYEAVIEKNGKKKEYLLNPNGSPKK